MSVGVLTTEKYDFYQKPPSIADPIESDPFLKEIVSFLIPPEIMAEIWDEIKEFAERVKETEKWAREAEINQPKLIHYDPWGKRVDRVEYCEQWYKLKAFSAEEELVRAAYLGRFGKYNRVYQSVKLYLFHPRSAFYTCPLAMTDGAAALIYTVNDSKLIEEVIPHLLSNDPKSFWTSGQWMTEKTGGSDVRSSKSVAIGDGKRWKLYGIKWFTSAIESEVAFTLATVEGSDKLSLFFVKTKKEDGSWNNLKILRLKDKLGTRALATAEVELLGTEALLVGTPDRGIAHIATILNVTRLYNAIGSVATMRYITSLAVDYSLKRKAFGKYIIEHPLHRNTLAEMQARTVGTTLFTFWLVKLFGNSSSLHLARLLTPLAKLFTAKEAIQVVSEGVEAIGGAGYIEDTDIPRFYRDTQVFSIWEGTTNVLLLDFLRAMKKEPGTLEQLYSILSNSIECVNVKVTLQNTFDNIKLLLQEKITPVYLKHLSFKVAELVIFHLIGAISNRSPRWKGIEEYWKFRILNPTPTARILKSLEDLV